MSGDLVSFTIVIYIWITILVSVFLILYKLLGLKEILDEIVEKIESSDNRK